LTEKRGGGNKPDRTTERRGGPGVDGRRKGENENLGLEAERGRRQVGGNRYLQVHRRPSEKLETKEIKKQEQCGQQATPKREGASPHMTCQVAKRKTGATGGGGGEGTGKREGLLVGLLLRKL